MAAPPLPVAAPQWSDADLVPYGLLSAAEIIENVSGAALGGVIYPYRCAPETGTWPGPCEDVPTGLTKTLPGGVSYVVGQPVPVYAFETCPLTAYTEQELERRAIESLRRTEQGLIEQALWAMLTARTDTQILTGTPLTITDALALAEWWLGRRQLRGMVHVNSVAAAFAADHDLLYPNRETAARVHFTPLGHRWVFGGGYGLNGPAGTSAPAGNTAWMFVTAPVVLRRSRIRAVSGLLHRSNEHDSRAERIYVPTLPCDVAAIPVATVTAPDGTPVPIPQPAMTLTVEPTAGDAPLTVTATVRNEQSPVVIDWGDA